MYAKCVIRTNIIIVIIIIIISSSSITLFGDCAHLQHQETTLLSVTAFLSGGECMMSRMPKSFEFWHS